eukprot:8643499-Ditylum_brightwellii.AAC.1
MLLASTPESKAMISLPSSIAENIAIALSSTHLLAGQKLLVYLVGVCLTRLDLQGSESRLAPSETGASELSSGSS